MVKLLDSFQNRGYYLIYITGGTAIAISAICWSFVSPAFRKVCLPYIPATTEQVSNILVAVRNSRGPVIDLGSGDGRIVIEVAKKLNIKAYGVELNPWLVFYSRLSALKHGVYGQVKFLHQDLFKTNLKPFNSIAIFGVSEMMTLVEEKLENEMSNDAFALTCRFPLPTWSPAEVIGQGINTVWLYKKPSTYKTK